MVSMLSYNSREKELSRIKNQIMDLAAVLTEDEWKVFHTESLQKAMEYASKEPLIHLACCDVTTAGSLTALEDIRKKHMDMLLMLIADNTISPMEYVKPEILASSLLLRPFSDGEFREKCKDLILRYISLLKEDSKDAFVVESKEGQTRIPYEQIYYIEAREKKLFLRLENKEVAFYDTLENLLQVLPANFLRCHRSFVVNKYYIEKVQLSQSMIWLSHGISVPLSRSCKPEFKDLKLL
ncbi:MAG: LytTR family DNA-binding domain-containing protein [Lachnospiraceae bacterium]|nr:LytTR family DNA-binding domain-containing protein [Lachnospiraceae bacterium]